MLNRHKIEKKGESCKVISLHHYARGETGCHQQADEIPESAEANVFARQAQVFEHLRALSSTIDRCGVAVATVVLMRDGSIDLTGIGVEPEYTSLVASGLETLANALRARRPNRKPKPKWRGSVSVQLAATIAFMAATYMNDIAWLDAVLSLFAQLTAGYFWWLGRKFRTRNKFDQ